jgi:hypothetical protein
VAAISIGFGVILIALGVGGFVGTGSEHYTALIPAALGLLLIGFGLLALREKLRMHAMHGAVLVGLLGFLGGATMIVRALLSDAPIRSVSFGMQIAMAVLCLVFVALCVKSFIEARRRRRQTNP